MLQATEAEIEILAKVLCAADDVRPTKRPRMTWRDYRGQATAAWAFWAVQKAHEAV